MGKQTIYRWWPGRGAVILDALAVRDRLRSAQRVGQLRPDVDLDLAVELLIGPPCHRWMQRTGPLDPVCADAVVDLALAALAPPTGEGLTRTRNG